MFYKLLLVFLTALVEIWLAVPLGIGMDLPIIPVVVVTACAGIVASYLVYWAGDELRDRIGKRFFKAKASTMDDDQSPHEAEKEQRKLDKRWIVQIWRTYGVIGLGLFAPLLTGAPIGVVIGFVFGADKKQLMRWIVIGIILWSVLLGIVSAFGWSLATE